MIIVKLLGTAVCTNPTKKTKYKDDLGLRALEVAHPEVSLSKDDLVSSIKSLLIVLPVNSPKDWTSRRKYATVVLDIIRDYYSSASFDDKLCIELFLRDVFSLRFRTLAECIDSCTGCRSAASLLQLLYNIIDVFDLAYRIYPYSLDVIGLREPVIRALRFLHQATYLDVLLARTFGCVCKRREDVRKFYSNFIALYSEKPDEMNILKKASINLMYLIKSIAFADKYTEKTIIERSGSSVTRMSVFVVGKMIKTHCETSPFDDPIYVKVVLQGSSPSPYVDSAMLSLVIFMEVLRKWSVGSIAIEDDIYTLGPSFISDSLWISSHSILVFQLFPFFFHNSYLSIRMVVPSMKQIELIYKEYDIRGIKNLVVRLNHYLGSSIVTFLRAASNAFEVFVLEIGYLYLGRNEDSGFEWLERHYASFRHPQRFSIKFILKDCLSPEMCKEGVDRVLKIVAYHASAFKPNEITFSVMCNSQGNQPSELKVCLEYFLGRREKLFQAAFLDEYFLIDESIVSQLMTGLDYFPSLISFGPRASCREIVFADQRSSMTPSIAKEVWKFYLSESDPLHYYNVNVLAFRDIRLDASYLRLLIDTNPKIILMENVSCTEQLRQAIDSNSAILTELVKCFVVPEVRSAYSAEATEAIKLFRRVVERNSTIEQ